MIHKWRPPELLYDGEEVYIEHPHEDLMLERHTCTERQAVYEVLVLARLLRGLMPPLLDALRNAADLDSHAIYDLLADTGIIRKEPYDPEVHKGDEYADSAFGEEIWVLTELGRRFAGKEG